ncbi:MAG: pentapeptide repeat-containing protein [Phormidesmis sp.]
MSAQTRKKATRKRQDPSKAAFSHFAPSHLAILQLGVSIWNQWRANEPLTAPNLRNADLSGFHLENVNLCRTDLRGANLSSAYLYEADFQEADLRRANLTRAGLIGANLHRANMTEATLQQAYLGQSDLSNANLTSSKLHKADLQSAILTGTQLKHAFLAEADLSDSFDLTAIQLTATEDAHLAYFSNALRIQMGLAPRGTDAEVLPSEREASPLAREPKWSGSVNTFRKTSRPVEVFQPTRKPSINQPALRRLAVQ